MIGLGLAVGLGIGIGLGLWLRLGFSNPEAVCNIHDLNFLAHTHTHRLTVNKEEIFFARPKQQGQKGSKTRS